MNIKGKAAIITGASRGVGKATALALARGDCAVLVNYSRSREEAEQTVEEARTFGVQAFSFQADVSEDDACRAMMDVAAKEFGRLDILVNNAGTTKFIPHSHLEDVTDEHWNRILGVNLKGTFQCTRAARKYMEASGEGEVVNVTSVAGITAAGSSIPYCASKAAQINLTISLARVLGPAIRVNSVAPGFIAGRWTQKGLGADYESVKQAWEARAVLGKVCRPEDVAAAILGIITGSDMITGQTIVCDGGRLIGPKW
ncbi:SDR family oxidoreductase [Acidobacteria bacterium AH-259-G07]|nr:SDR family oxidoreductase [Acidobacteria bacterium AH-259-G07]